MPSLESVETDPGVTLIGKVVLKKLYLPDNTKSHAGAWITLGSTIHETRESPRFYWQRKPEGEEAPGIKVEDYRINHLSDGCWEHVRLCLFAPQTKVKVSKRSTMLFIRVHITGIGFFERQWDKTEAAWLFLAK